MNYSGKFNKKSGLLQSMDVFLFYSPGGLLPVPGGIRVEDI
jgi:hypothetical protein